MSLYNLRRAFTLIELLVVIAVIGILIGLLLPAVQSAREAARRMQCSNNLKQFGLALHNYHSALDCFPGLGATSGTSYSVQARLTPFMEQSPMHDMIDFDTPIMVDPDTANASAQSSRPGLLILTHGSPSPNWNQAITTLADKVAKLNETKKTFHAVVAVNMEFAQPDAAAGIETLQKAGCGRIIVVPAFICPTSHSHFDVPASLGLYSSPQTRRTMKEENVKPAAPKVPVTITQTMNEGDLLDKYVCDELKTLSIKPEEEAILLIAHGDEGHGGLVEAVMRRLLAKACGSSGMTCADWTFCEVRQSYTQNVVPLIQEMSKKRKRVLVVGLYLVASAKTIDRAGTSRNRQQIESGSQASKESVTSPLDGIDVRFSERGVIEHPDTPSWILQSASEEL